MRTEKEIQTQVVKLTKQRRKAGRKEPDNWIYFNAQIDALRWVLDEAGPFIAEAQKEIREQRGPIWEDLKSRGLPRTR